MLLINYIIVASLPLSQFLSFTHTQTDKQTHALTPMHVLDMLTNQPMSNVVSSIHSHIMHAPMANSVG